MRSLHMSRPTYLNTCILAYLYECQTGSPHVLKHCWIWATGSMVFLSKTTKHLIRMNHNMLVPAHADQSFSRGRLRNWDHLSDTSDFYLSMVVRVAITWESLMVNTLSFCVHWLQKDTEFPSVVPAGSYGHKRVNSPHSNTRARNNTQACLHDCSS